MNKCGGERLKAHSSYTWKASLKEGIAWLQALLSSYRSAKSSHSLVAILLLSLKLPFIPRLPSFSYAVPQAIKTVPPLRLQNLPMHVLLSHYTFSPL